MSQIEPELRFSAAPRLAVRTPGSDVSPLRQISGYAAVFNTETDIGGYFLEEIAPEAFDDALSRSDVHALINHDPTQVLGRLSAETLRLSVDDIGLRVEIDPPDTEAARALLTSIGRGDIDQMSFGFIAAEDGVVWEDRTGTPKRRITRIDQLFDVSVCARGAYDTTSCALRSLEHFKNHRKCDAQKRRMRMSLTLRQTRNTQPIG